MFSKKWLAIILAGALTPVILSGCQKEATKPQSPEQLVAKAYADSIKSELEYFERTIEFLPPNVTEVKLIGNGWVSFVWNRQCFIMSDQYHNVIKSAAMITTMDMNACLNYKDLRHGPTLQGADTNTGVNY